MPHLLYPAQKRVPWLMWSPSSSRALPPHSGPLLLRRWAPSFPILASGSWAVIPLLPADLQVAPRSSWAWPRGSSSMKVGHRRTVCNKNCNKYGFPGGSAVKSPPANTGDPGLSPRSGRSSGGGNGNPLQDSCLENPMDGGAWWATVNGAQRVRSDWVIEHAQLSNTP